MAVLLVGIITLPGGRGGRRKSTGIYLWDGARRVQRPWSYYELEQTRAAIQRLGILTYQAPSEFEVPKALRLLAELCEREEHFPDHGLPPVASLSPKLGFLATQLTGVTGVGPGTARAIASQFGTFARFYEAGVKELQQVEGVGKVMAQRIWAAFHDLDRDQPLTMERAEALA